MKFGHLDKVMVERGHRQGEVGTVQSRSQIHRGQVAETPKYLLSFSNSKPEEFLEDNLTLYEKYDKDKSDKEAKDKILAARAETDRQSDLKLEEALRKKILRELEIRAEVEAEFAAKKAKTS